MILTPAASVEEDKKGKGKGEGEDKRFCLFRTITKMGWGWVGDGLGWIIL